MAISCDNSYPFAEIFLSHIKFVPLVLEATVTLRNIGYLEHFHDIRDNLKSLLRGEDDADER